METLPTHLFPVHMNRLNRFFPNVEGDKERIFWVLEADLIPPLYCGQGHPVILSSVLGRYVIEFPAEMHVLPLVEFLWNDGKRQIKTCFPPAPSGTIFFSSFEYQGLSGRRMVAIYDSLVYEEQEKDNWRVVELDGRTFSI
jgi:hypothetical protein